MFVEADDEPTPPVAREEPTLAPAMPREAPLAMPVQSLYRFSRRSRRRWIHARQPHAVRLARLVAFGGDLLLTAYGAREMYGVVSVGQITFLEWAMVVLFVINFSWIALAFTASLYGFFYLLVGGPARRPLPKSLSIKTAVVMPIYNEAPSRVFAALQAIEEEVAATGLGDAFDFFFLSDTTNPDIWIAEERALIALRQRRPNARFYYRRRKRNIARKAGNIADFVSRWGAAYPQMLVLDADSFMTGETIVRLAEAMENDPDAGIIQSLPLIVNRNTFFARLQQFAARVTGPVLAAGLTAWMGRDGNYWGHNAIIRTRAFADHCGMPNLPGKPPFGGHILSHDFVEAALMRRAGWAVYMLPTLGGSYEESPPSLIDLATRDRRWCQGNMQHISVLPSAGFTLATRQHFITGIMGYLVSPFWMAQLVIGIVLVLQSKYIRPEYFTADFSLFPTWPVFDYIRALHLFELTIAVLLAPKFLGLALVLVDRKTRREFGGTIRVTTVVARRNPGLVRRRADHDADPDGIGGPDLFWPRHRLEPTAARRRIDPVQEHRAAPSLAHGDGSCRAHIGRPAFAFVGGVDVADHCRPHPRDTDFLGERAAMDRRRVAQGRHADDARGAFPAAGHRARQCARPRARQNRPRRRGRAARDRS